MVPLNGATGVTLAMDYQVMFNIALALSAGLGGWVLNNVTTNLKTLGTDLRKLDKEHQVTRETYVSKAEHKEDIAGLSSQIEKLDGKIDHGVEKLELKLDRVLERLPHMPLTP